MSFDFDDVKQRYARRQELERQGRTLVRDALSELQERFEVLPSQIEERYPVISSVGAIESPDLNDKLDPVRALESSPDNTVTEIRVGLAMIRSHLRHMFALSVPLLVACVAVLIVDHSERRRWQNNFRTQVAAQLAQIPREGDGLKGLADGAQYSGLDYAVAHLRQALNPDPKDPSALESAERTLESYLSNCPEDVDMRCRLIRFYLAHQKLVTDPQKREELSKRIGEMRQALPAQLRGSDYVISPYGKK